MQQVGFRIRDEVFARAKFQVGFNTSKLETIYKDAFGEDLTMDTVKYPRYTLFKHVIYSSTCYNLCDHSIVELLPRKGT